MGRSTGVEVHDVWNAAETLVHEGLQPTAERIRQKLGRSSRDHIGPHLEAWFAGLAPRLDQAPPAADVPPGVLAAADHLWRSACEQAETRAQATIASLEQALDQLRADLASAAEASKNVETTLRASLDDTLADLESQRQQAARDAQRLTLAGDALAHRDAELDAARRAADDLQLRIDGLRAAADEAGAEWQLRIDVLERQCRDAVTESAARGERLSSLEEGLATAVAERDASRAAAAAAAEENEQLMRTLAQEREASLAERATRLVDFDAQRHTLEEQHAASERRLAADIDRARDEAGQVYLKLVAAERERDEYANLAAALAANEEAQREAVAQAHSEAAESRRQAQAIRAELEAEHAAREHALREEHDLLAQRAADGAERAALELEHATAAAVQLETKLDAAEREASATIALMSERLEAMRSQNEALADQVSTSHARIQGLEARLATEDAIVADQHGRLAEQDSRLGELDARCAEQASRLSEQETRLAEQEAQLADQEAQLVEQSNQLAEQHARMQEQEARIAEQRERLAEHEARAAAPGEHAVVAEAPHIDLNAAADDESGIDAIVGTTATLDCVAADPVAGASRSVESAPLASGADSEEVARLQAELAELKGQLWAKDAQCRTLMRSLAAQTAIAPSLPASHRIDKTRRAPTPRSSRNI
ncbi:MAG TPA: DNA-binding protein [Burkholderiaceae bacterium]|nr:DNA-binding protein [Burkholderiaceae bacterium]